MNDLKKERILMREQRVRRKLKVRGRVVKYGPCIT